MSASSQSSCRTLLSPPPPPLPSPLQETLQDQQGVAAMESLLLPSKHGVSVSPSPEGLLQSSPTALQSQMLWGLFLPMPDSQAGEPGTGLRALTHMGEFLQHNDSPDCGSPTWVGWDLIIL